MYRLKLFFAIACICFSFTGCKKDSAGYKCEELKNAVITGADDDIKSIITHFINRLPSKKYTEENVNALLSSLTNECSVTTALVCYDCVYTLPSMSEIQITVTSNQVTASKTVDITYTPDNNMRCAGVHD